MEPSIVYRSAAMSKVMELLERVSGTDANVLISGESGVGKSLLAEQIHRLGGRRDRPFVTVPCANLPAELFESELFGHEPGAHTDATERRAGKFEAADGGTVLLDGVEAMASPLQAKLLRVVQEKSFERLGGTHQVTVDIRLIASAGETIEQEVKAGRFREDLFYRLNVVHLKVPPLRERADDIGPLASHFLRLLSARHGGGQRRLTTEARRVLKAYRWPGNVRELSNILESAVIATEGREIDVAKLGINKGTVAEEAVREAFEKRWSLDALEAAYIREVLKAARGNKSRAAAVLGINRKTLLQKLKRSGH
ncbi:MAG TPA: sigma-54 dependent transcriptional regulator [Patescibacteria group bacterium]|jgi:Nif-specific regulatory protein|nr:sigma-54 dependent transcriptional regulator [Patescibacteria group bacterium]